MITPHLTLKQLDPDHLCPLNSYLEEDVDSDCTPGPDWLAECAWRYDYPLERYFAWEAANQLIAGRVGPERMGEEYRGRLRTAALTYVIRPSRTPVIHDQERVSRWGIYLRLLIDAGLIVSGSTLPREIASGTELAEALRYHFERVNVPMPPNPLDHEASAEWTRLSPVREAALRESLAAHGFGIAVVGGRRKVIVAD